jgi:hypothetical protein
VKRYHAEQSQIVVGRISPIRAGRPRPALISLRVKGRVLSWQRVALRAEQELAERLRAEGHQAYCSGPRLSIRGHLTAVSKTVESFGRIDVPLTMLHFWDRFGARRTILGLTKSAAQEYAREGIRVNALVAGEFDTDMLHNPSNKLWETTQLRSTRVSKDMQRAFPWAESDSLSKQLTPLFGYAAAPLYTSQAYQ